MSWLQYKNIVVLNISKYCVVHYWLTLFCVCVPQPVQRTFDYVLVAQKVEDDSDHRLQRRKLFIQALQKKNITVTVSLPHLFHLSHD